MIIPILVATVASLGLGLILSDLLRVPSFAVSKSTHNLGKRQNKKTNPIELWLKEIAGTLAGKLKINEYKRLQLEADLRTADMPTTPEQYIANCIVKSGFVALFAIPLFFVSKLLALIALGASVLMYNKAIVSDNANKRHIGTKCTVRALPRITFTLLVCQFNRNLYSLAFFNALAYNLIRKTKVCIISR